MNLESDTLSRTRVKRSSGEVLIKRSAPDADRIDNTKMFPSLIFDLLNNGHEVKFRAPGYSMYPTILHEDVITVEPIKSEAIKVGDIVLYQSENSVIAHRVVKIKNKSDTHTCTQPSVLSPQSCFILRGDARPVCDDPINAEQILGKIVSVQRNGRCINPYSLKVKLNRYARRLLSCLKRLLN